MWADRRLPFYRSPITRFGLAVTGGFLAAVFSPLGPDQWRDTPSLHWLHQCLPWPLLSALFLIYTLLLIWGSLPAIVTAETIGLILYGWEFVALLVTSRTDKPTNPFALAAVLLACVLHAAAVRLTIIQIARASGG